MKLRMLLHAFFAALCFVGLAVLLLRLLLPSMAFHPTRGVERTPRDAGLAYEDVWLTASDGVRLNGWYVPAANARATLLFFHGNGGNLAWRVGSIEIFHKLGLSVFIIDYRGYGKSEGSPDVAGVGLDAVAAWLWLLENKNTKPEEIVLFGRSLGGAIALELTRSVQPKAVILESTFASPFGVVRVDFLAPLLRLAVGDIWNSRSAARRLTVPALCIHSPDDEIVPFKEGRKLYEALAGEKTFLEIHGGHNEGFMESLPVYYPALDAFLTRHFGPTTEN